MPFVAGVRRVVGMGAVFALFLAGLWMAAGLRRDAVPGAAPQEFAVISRLGDGGYFPGTIVVEEGRPVRLYGTSVDVVHEFLIPEFRVEAHFRPGVVETVEFIPTRTGTFRIFCEYHPDMTGTLVVAERGQTRR